MGILNCLAGAFFGVGRYSVRVSIPTCATRKLGEKFPLYWHATNATTQGASAREVSSFLATDEYKDACKIRSPSTKFNITSSFL